MQKLGEENKKLNDDIASLKEEKHRLEMDNQRMASALINSNNKMFFLQGYMDSVRYEFAAFTMTSTFLSVIFPLTSLRVLLLSIFHSSTTITVI